MANGPEISGRSKKRLTFRGRSWREIMGVSTMSLHEVLRSAERADALGQHAEVVRLATQLIQAGDPWLVSGYMLRAFAYEYGANEGVEDLMRATNDFRQLVLIAPHTISYTNLARVGMKKGHDGYPAALAHLSEASKLGKTPELYLAFAHYWRTAPEPDLEVAKRYFLQAAIRGRFRGFFGYAEVSRALGQPVRAFIADVARIFSGPFLWMLLRSKASASF